MNLESSHTSSAMWGHSEKMDVCAPDGRSSQDTESASDLIFDFLICRTVISKFLLLIIPNLYVCLFCLLFFFCFCFLGLHLWHMEVPRLEVESELQLLAYATATAMRDLSRVCDLDHSSWWRQILNPLCGARGWTPCILMDTSQIHFRWAKMEHHFCGSSSKLRRSLKGMQLKFYQYD